MAPEIEFYLVAKNDDPDYPLHPPKGRSGRSILGGQSYSIAGINEFDELIDDIYHFSEKQGLEIDTLIHEEGPAQLEINLRHGDPIELADQVFLFKRTIREAALKHGIYATFMAKPMQGQPGSAMHIHQSVVNRSDRQERLFQSRRFALAVNSSTSSAACRNTCRSALSMLAPYVNSYRRLTPDMSAPVNNAWGYDNRTTAFRVPVSDPQARRVENRLPSSDANPYLALAGIARLRPARHHEGDRADGADRGFRQRRFDRPAARPAGSRRAAWKTSPPSKRCSARNSSAFMPA